MTDIFVGAGENYTSIDAAANAARQGDTVIVEPGVYNEVVSSSVDGTASAPIRIVSQVPGQAVIRPSNADGTIVTLHGNHTTFEGFQVDGSNSPQARVGVWISGVESTVLNNEVHHIRTAGVDDSNGGAGILAAGGYWGRDQQHVVGNEVHHIGTPDSTRIHGIYHQDTGSIVNNLVHSNPGLIGIVLWHDARNITIANNTVFDNGLGISVGSGDWYHGEAPADNVRVVNNIVYSNEASGIQEAGLSGTNNVYENNLVYRNGNNWSLQNGLRHKATVTSDPQFMDYRGGDYHLRPTSPAIDAGTMVGVPTLDKDGLPRPYGAAADIGVYEWRPKQ